MNNLRKLVIIALICCTMVFFLPWFTMNLESELFENSTTISGLKIARYAENIKPLVDNLRPGFSRQLTEMILSSLKYIYILPIVSALAALLHIFRIRIAAFISLVVLALYFIIAMSVLLIPVFNQDIGIFLNLLFVVTPSLYIILAASAIGAAASVFISRQKTAPQ